MNSDVPVPFGDLTVDAAGDFFGGFPYGGANNDGLIFKLTPAGAYSEFYTFSDTDGVLSAAALTLGTDGDFYGAAATSSQAANSAFRLTTGAALTSIATGNFYNGGDGPPIVQGSDNQFYGFEANTGFSRINSDGSLTAIGRARRSS